MIKSVEFNGGFIPPGTVLPLESSSNFDFTDEVLTWLGNKDSSLDTRVGMGVCYLTAFFMIGQIFRYVFS
ncbi:hypothetical protein [Desulforamulus ruminis]|uniref:Uncharacterized protein n=2 Tax=Desulforamulus ruminis TaxID=1564 RepID=F6DSC4_DESRL|nr:hypothetical protein [Desulforamulus ruminis]AEG59903.1 hypothetical protein Desru_1638 [Desulforamulus ruminis DSM 2154]